MRFDPDGNEKRDAVGDEKPCRKCEFFVDADAKTWGWSDWCFRRYKLANALNDPEFAACCGEDFAGDCRHFERRRGS